MTVLHVFLDVASVLVTAATWYYVGIGRGKVLQMRQNIKEVKEMREQAEAKFTELIIETKVESDSDIPHLPKHIFMHALTNELVDDFIIHNPHKEPETTTVRELLNWSATQIVKPTPLPWEN